MGAVHRIVARVNNHSLAMLEEMLDFVSHENIHDVRRVNHQAAAWASRVNQFDFEVQEELAQVRCRIVQDALWATGGQDGPLAEVT